MNSFKQLRKHNLTLATRAFNARGSSLQRCGECLLAMDFCICSHMQAVTSYADVVLLMHHDELFKPTNSGRLIAQVLPANTYVFEWSRTKPQTELLELLHSPARQCYLIFPPSPESQNKVIVDPCEHPTGKIPTCVLLDGTWRQAARMSSLSRHLQQLPLLDLGVGSTQYTVRKAIRTGQMSTAEAGIACLNLFGDALAACRLDEVFEQFRKNYWRSRGRTPPAVNSSAADAG